MVILSIDLPLDHFELDFLLVWVLFSGLILTVRLSILIQLFIGLPMRFNPDKGVKGLALGSWTHHWLLHALFLRSYLVHVCIQHQIVVAVDTYQVHLVVWKTVNMRTKGTLLHLSLSMVTLMILLLSLTCWRGLLVSTSSARVGHLQLSYQLRIDIVHPKSGLQWHPITALQVDITMAGAYCLAPHRGFRVVFLDRMAN